MSNQKQFHIQDETGKKVSVSRDAFNLLQRNEKRTKAKQERLEQEVHSLKNELTKKRYYGEARDMEISALFNKNGEINEHELKINFKKDVSEETQKILFQFLVCFNQAVTGRNADMAKGLYNKSNQLEESNAA